MSKKRVLNKEIAEQFSMIQELKKLECVLKVLKFLNPERDLLGIFDLRGFLFEDAGDACISYDGECIYDDDSYAEIIELYKCAGFQGDEVTVNHSFYDKVKKRAGISFAVNGFIFEGDWVQEDDWISHEFLDLLSEAESKMNGEILLVPGNCQAVMQLYVPSTHARIIKDSFERLYEIEWCTNDDNPVISPDVLSKFISIQNDAANFLANCNYDLSLDGLTQISDKAAHSLSKNKGKLSLNGLAELSDAAAESLSKHQGEISLNGLDELSNAAAESLAKHEGDLYLNGLTKLSDEAIFFLAKKEDNLHVSEEIATQIRSYHKNQKAEDVRTVKEPADSKNRSILTVEIAEQFIEDEDSVDLAEFTEIDDAAAESLSRKTHKELWLYGLTKLSDAAAESLSKHEGGLHLSGLTELSDAAAESLSKHEGNLDLDGLTELSDAAAESLSKHKGKLELSGLTEVSLSIAKKLANQEDGVDLDLSNIKKISSELACILASHRGITKASVGCLILDGLTEINTQVAGILSDHEGPLSLNGLSQLSKDVAIELSNHQGTLTLDGLVSIDEEVADVLSNHWGSLILNGLVKLSQGAAKSLSSHSKGMKWVLSLEGIQSLSRTAAKNISYHEGILRLPREIEEEVLLFSKHFDLMDDNVIPIYEAAMSESYWRHDEAYDETTWDNLGDEFAKYRSITDSAAAWLATECDNIKLPRLKKINKVAAVSFLDCKDGIELDGLSNLGKDVAEVFSGYDGQLSLRGLSRLTDEEIFFLAKIPEGNLCVSEEIATQIRSYPKNQKAEDVRTVKEPTDSKNKSKEQKKEKPPEKKVERKGGLPQSFLDLYN